MRSRLVIQDVGGRQARTSWTETILKDGHGMSSLRRDKLRIVLNLSVPFFGRVKRWFCTPFPEKGTTAPFSNISWTYPCSTGFPRCGIRSCRGGGDGTHSQRRPCVTIDFAHLSPLQAALKRCSLPPTVVSLSRGKRVAPAASSFTPTRDSPGPAPSKGLTIGLWRLLPEAAAPGESSEGS